MIEFANLVYRVEPMRPDDIPQVMEIEQVSFSAPWSARAYDYELHYNEMAHYFVVIPQEKPTPLSRASGRGNGSSTTTRSLWERLLKVEKKPDIHTGGRSPVVGYGGLWMMVDEAHISTIASHPDWRGRGIGELLLLAMIENASDIGAQVVTLEVRISNFPAQSLYRKYGLLVAGTRKGYYSDNREDAYIMTTPPITTDEYANRLTELRSALAKRLAQ